MKLQTPRPGRHSISHIVDYELIPKDVTWTEAEATYMEAGLCLPKRAWHIRQVGHDYESTWSSRYMGRMTGKLVGTTIDKLIQREVRDDVPTSPEDVVTMYANVRHDEMTRGHGRWMRRDETRGDAAPMPPAELLDDKLITDMASIASAGAEMVLRAGTPIYQHERWTANSSPCDHIIKVDSERCSYGIVDWMIRGAKRGWHVLADIKITKRHLGEQPKAQAQLLSYLIADAARAYDMGGAYPSGVMGMNPRRGTIEWIDISELISEHEDTAAALAEHVLGFKSMRAKQILDAMRTAATEWEAGA